MEPVTHLLTGAVLARAGLNRRAAYATAAMVIAAEFPDIDTLWSLGGPLTGFEHHRGITHTFVGIPFEAALITLGFYLFDRLRKPQDKAAPRNWLWLYAGTLLALLSHLLLDWTNNYGLRPFFPFNPRWYAGSFVFIFEPVLFLILVAALAGPVLFGLINAEVGSRRQLFRGRPSALAALVAIAGLYVFRAQQHSVAIDMTQQNDAQAQRVFASPEPINPFRWHMVADTGEALVLSTVNSRTGIVDPPQPSDTLFKPAPTLPILAAKRAELGRIYLDWSSYPVLNEAPDTSDPNHPLSLVTFADARFLYDVPFMNGREHPPISASVLLDMQAPEGQRVVETRFNNKLQK